MFRAEVRLFAHQNAVKKATLMKIKANNIFLQISPCQRR